MIPEHAQTHNVAEIVPHPDTGDPVLCRIPDSLRMCLNPNAQRRALNSAGCELRFRMEGDRLVLRFRSCEIRVDSHGGGNAQILFGDFSHTCLKVDEREVIYELKCPNLDLLETAATNRIFHPRLVRVLFPTHAAITGLSVDGDLRPPLPGDVPPRRLLIYGSSITQGAGSLTVRESWAGHCAHLLGMDLINLGFGSGCHCEPEMSEYLAKRNDWDIAVLETGINMLEIDRREADERIVNLIRAFSDAHPDKPVFCVGVFPCADDIRNNFRGRAREIHELVGRTVADLRRPRLHFIDGTRALQHARGMTTDLTHPSPAGMIEIGGWVAVQILNNQ